MKYIFCLFLLFFNFKLISQTYTAPIVGINGSFAGGCPIGTNTGTYVDDGGAGGNYSLNISSIYQTICPTTANQSIVLTFTSFDMENGFDYISIGNGPAQNSSVFVTAPANASGQITGTPTVPFTYTATNTSGCLTIRTVSDVITVAPGFSATISVVNNGSTLAAGNSDCSTSTYICSNTAFNDVSYGPGLTPDEGCLSSCLTGEAYSNWYSFSALTTGTLTLTINPNTNTDDYDFAVFGPNTLCGTAPIRCSFASAAGNGNTGLTLAAIDLTEGAMGDGDLANLNVIAGETYQLYVNSWTAGGAGFAMTFGGTALMGTIAPIINSISACGTVSNTLTATPAKVGGTYLWSPGGQTTQSITVSPAVTSVYSCVYTIDGCTSASGSGTITVVAPAVATFSYAASPYCSNAANPSPTYSGGGVAGTFSSSAGLVFVSTATGQINLATSTPGTYTVTNTIAASAPCGVITATSSITITGLPVGTFSYVGTPYCSSGIDPLPTFGVGATGGTFTSTVGSSLTAGTGLVDLSACTVGAYTVTNTIAASLGCPIVIATSTITINAPAVATFSYVGTPFCVSGVDPSPTFSGGGIAGTFSSTAGLIITAGTGLVDLSLCTVGSYTVTNTIAATGGCPVITATSGITVSAGFVATFSYVASPYCSDAVDPSPTYSGGGIAGTFTSLPAGLSITAGSGLVDVSASTAGIYTVTNSIAASGGCAATSAFSTITVTTAPVGSFSYVSSPYCSNGVDPSPTFSGGGVAGTFSSAAGLSIIALTGLIDLSASTAGAYTVTNTIAASGGCAAITPTSSITITAVPVGTFSYIASPYCSNGVDPSPTYSGGGVGGVFTAGAGLSINSVSGLVDLSASTAGLYIVTNTIAASGGCAAVTPTSTITINALPVGTFSYVASPYCSNGVDPLPTYSGGGVAGAFSSTVGLSINAVSGLVDLSASTAGLYTVTNTIAAVGACPSSAPTSTITITTLPVGTFSYVASPYCSNGVDPSPTYSGGGVAGSYTSAAGLSINGASGLIDLSATTAGIYTVTNTIAAASGCSAVTNTSSITVTTLPVATFSYIASPYCSNGVDPTPTFSGGGVAGTFTSLPALIITAGSGLIDLSASTSGTYSVTNTIAAATGCASVNSSSNVTITAVPVSTFSYVSSPYCSDASDPLPTFSGGGVGGTFTSAAGIIITGGSGLIDLSASTAGTYSVTNTIAAASGCPAITSSSNITITALPVSVFSYVASPFCSDGTNPLPTFTAGVSGSLTSTAGLSINSVTGLVDLATSTAGTYSVTNTIAAAAGCSAVTSNSNITINSIPLALVLSNDTSYCSIGTPSNIVAIDNTLGAGIIEWYSDLLLTDSIGTGSFCIPSMLEGTNQYYATVTLNGCVSPSSVSVQIINLCDIEVPTAFTPDGNLVNDTWDLAFIDKAYPKNTITIYNRWGNLVFESSQGSYNTKPWDGTLNGQALPIESYYFIIKYNDGSTADKTGTVTIVKK